MKPLYIETRKKFNNKIDFSLLDKIKTNTISLAASVQYLNLIPEIKSYLESKNKKVIIKQGPIHEAQVLGCNPQAFDKSAETLLLVTSGKFHAINNATQLQKPITIFTGNSLEEITKEDLEKHNRKIQAKQKKFLTSKKIGLLVSTKLGQNFKQIQKIKNKIQSLDKKVYIFESNNISPEEFENFPQIQIFINTACYGIARDHPKITNLQDIQKFLQA